MGRLYNMGTTAEKLYRILDSKRAIKEALEAKGVVITDETTFSEYADLINEIVQGAISDADALTFIMDVAEGKRKIAKAVRNKYEGTKGSASEITEYSTFDELSNKISEIPIEVPMGNAMEQNGGVLPFYDVYNETLKAMASVGTEFNGCCAFELDKWDYDNDHTITLSGASAYYTSDKGELITADTEYQFKDIDQPNTNRFVVYFFDIEEGDKYQVPKSLPPTSCLNLWCVKGTPLMNFNGDFTVLNSVNVYDGELDVIDANDFKFNAVGGNQKLRLSHIKEIKNGSGIFYSNGALREVSLPNLTTISGGSSIFYGNNALLKLVLPNLTTISGGTQTFYANSKLKLLSLPNLTKITNVVSAFYGNGYVYYDLPNLKEIDSNGNVFVQHKTEELYLPNLNLIRINSSNMQSIMVDSPDCKKFNFPKLKHIIMAGYNPFFVTSSVGVTELNFQSVEKIEVTASYCVFTQKDIEIHLGNTVGGAFRFANSATSRIKLITIEKGFKSTLNLSYLTALTADCINAIIDNLAVCEGEDKDKYTITLSKSVATTEMESAIVAKGYLFATLG